MVKIKNKQTLLLEHDCYALVPEGKDIFREVSADHLDSPIPSRVYARLKGKAKQLFVVDIEESGVLPARKIFPKHARYFRARGYKIPKDNRLECLSMETLHNSAHEILFG